MSRQGNGGRRPSRKTVGDSRRDFVSESTPGTPAPAAHEESRENRPQIESSLSAFTQYVNVDSGDAAGIHIPTARMPESTEFTRLTPSHRLVTKKPHAPTVRQELRVRPDEGVLYALFSEFRGWAVSACMQFRGWAVLACVLFNVWNHALMAYRERVLEADHSAEFHCTCSDGHVEIKSDDQQFKAFADNQWFLWWVAVFVFLVARINQGRFGLMLFFDVVSFCVALRMRSGGISLPDSQTSWRASVCEEVKDVKFLGDPFKWDPDNDLDDFLMSTWAE